MDLSITNILTLVLILVVLFVVSKVYEFVYVPWSYRRLYKKYPNVMMTSKFYPLLGEVKLIQQNVSSGK